MMEESENPMKMMMVRSSIVRTVVLALGVAALGALPAIAQDTLSGIRLVIAAPWAPGTLATRSTIC